MSNLWITLLLTMGALCFGFYAVGQYYVIYCMAPTGGDLPGWARALIAVRFGGNERGRDEYRVFLLRQAALGLIGGVFLLALLLSGRISN